MQGRCVTYAFVVSKKLNRLTNLAAPLNLPPKLLEAFASVAVIADADEHRARAVYDQAR